MRVSASACFILTLALAGCDDRRPSASDGGVPQTDGAAALPDGGGGGGRDAAGVGPTGPVVDPNCADGQFSESLPDPTADLSDLVAGYDSANPTAFIEAALGRRYTTGQVLVREGRSPMDCVGVFLRDTSSAMAIYPQLSTVVHECGHFYDLEVGGFSDSFYYINDSPLEITCREGDTTSRGGQTFARSRIRDDSFSSARPACGGSPGRGCDFYSDIYLDGDPDDGSFDGGDQGFNSVLEETVQYVNSLATSYAFHMDLGSGSSSQRDGILTFLWYVERYLHFARNNFPSAYEHIVNGDGGCWRNAILTVWGRAWLYLQTTEGLSNLGISDDELEALVLTPELLAEIQRLRDAEGCTTGG